MLHAIAFDITDNKRRYQVNKVLLRYGTRVQKSVFEAHITQKQLETIKQKLWQVIDPTTDSLRYYNLGDVWRDRVTIQGTSELIPELEYIVV